MSWSEDRIKEIKDNKDIIINKLININSILRKLAIDDDLSDDLNDSIVKIAIKHWTNEERLEINEAKKLEDNYRVISVLKKLQILQHACQSAGFPVPLDHFLFRRNSLSYELINKIFGEEITRELKTKQEEKYFNKNNSSSSSSSSSLNNNNNNGNNNSTSNKNNQNSTTKTSEYGPHLPNSSNSNKNSSKENINEINKSDNDNTPKILSWGKEPYGTPEFSWFKFLSRTTLELVLVSILAIIVANGLNSKNKK